MQVEVDIQTPCGWATQAGEPIADAVWQQWFQTWLADLDPQLSPLCAYTLSLRLTHDADIQALNARYRQQDRATDVLAFAALEAEGMPVQIWTESPLELGDIVISVETAQVQALQRGHSLRQELAWLACHGLLHLLGWDHPTPERLEAMLAQQEQLLQVIGLGETDAAVEV